MEELLQNVTSTSLREVVVKSISLKMVDWITFEIYAKAPALGEGRYKSQVPRSNEVYNPQAGVHGVL